MFLKENCKEIDYENFTLRNIEFKKVVIQKRSAVCSTPLFSC